MEFRQYGFVCTGNDLDKALKKFEWAYKLKNNETAFLSLILNAISIQSLRTINKLYHIKKKKTIF